MFPCQSISPLRKSAVITAFAEDGSRLLSLDGGFVTVLCIGVDAGSASGLTGLGRVRCCADAMAAGEMGRERTAHEAQIGLAFLMPPADW